MKTDYETDLFVAHYKIENLEACLEQYKVIITDTKTKYNLGTVQFGLSNSRNRFELPHGKTNNLHMRKQRRRSASR